MNFARTMVEFDKDVELDACEGDSIFHTAPGGRGHTLAKIRSCDAEQAGALAHCVALAAPARKRLAHGLLRYKGVSTLGRGMLIDYDVDENEAWESRVPTDLQFAVDHLRSEFHRGGRTSGNATRRLCYLSLHEDFDGLAAARKEYGSQIDYLLERVGHVTAQRFSDLLAQDNLSAFFSAYSSLYTFSRLDQALEVFSQLLQIGQSNQDLLTLPAVHWATWQTTHLIWSHRHEISDWVRRACDGDAPASDCDDSVYGKTWRAPLFLMMEPARSQPYDKTRVWERMTSRLSNELLESLEGDYISIMEFGLGRQAGKAALGIAKQPRIDPISTATEQRKKRKSKTPTYAEPGRTAAFFAVLQLHLKARNYCKELDRLGIPIPTRWVDGGCPPTYAQAYVKNLDWRQRIQDEKVRMRKKYDALDTSTRELFIQQHFSPKPH